jgi:hypothetical protein
MATMVGPVRRARKPILPRMSATAPDGTRRLAAPLLVLAGIAVAAAAWLVPVNLKSVSPALLRAAGLGTPSLSQFGRQLVDAEKMGPASLVLAAARSIGDPGAAALERELGRMSALQPNAAAWGGWDPFLDPLFDLRAPSGRPADTPVMAFLITEKARETMRRSLSNSGSLGAQLIFQTRTLPATGRFTPVGRPGGEPLDALISLSALLYQGEHLSPPLRRELRTMAEAAIAQRQLGDLAPFYADLLSLARRLDWVQLCELLRRTESVKTVAAYAQLARVAPDQFPVIYGAALSTDSADRVASYLILYGKAGAGDLRLALADGRGAVRLLVLRQVPVNRTAGPGLDSAGALVLAHPRLMLAMKYLGYLAGLFLLLRGLDRWIVAPGGAGRPRGGASEVTAGILAVFLAALVVVATEPFLLRAAPASEYRPVLRLPMLAATAPSPISSQTAIPTMDSSTILSIGIFALLQVVVYFICLQKINQIGRQAAPPALKLRLMENEENLFDSGLYVGMMGTAAALVLQVLGVIQPNLLAAYSSNLFGIVCVALVKIRHVRGFKRSLILEKEGAAQTGIA